MLKLRRAGKAQSKTVLPDWQAMGAAERTIGNDIYFSREHHFKCSHFSVKFYEFSNHSAPQSSLSFLTHPAKTSLHYSHICGNIYPAPSRKPRSSAAGMDGIE
jgi:hypothetical protein